MSNEQLSLGNVEAPTEFSANLELITPEAAAIMLQFNRQNRKINQGLVDEKVRQLLDGDFLLNGETIKLSWPVDVPGSDGVKLPILLDGQHRLEAVVRSGVSVTILVVRGLDPKTQSTMDIGRKRTTGDVMRINGEKEYTNLGTALGGIWKWNTGDRMFASKPSPTPPECEKLLAEEEERIRRALEVGCQTGHDFRDLSKTSLTVAHYVLAALDVEHVPYFFRLIGTGVGLSEGHPVLALRNRASTFKRTKQPMPMRRQVGLIVKAWNRCVQDEKVGSITQTVAEPSDEPLNPMGRWIPMLTSAEFNGDEQP